MLDQEIKDLELQGKEMFLISDIRTQKELKYCKENGFKVIKIMSSKPFHPQKISIKPLPPPSQVPLIYHQKTPAPKTQIQSAQKTQST